MTVDIEKLEALAKSFPELDFDSNTEPFFNGPSGESLGGGSTGFYCVYGKPFEIDGELYDGNEYVSTCNKEFAQFMCTAKQSVLELIADLKRNQRMLLSAVCQLGEISAALGADMDSDCDELIGMIADLKSSVQGVKSENKELKEKYEYARDRNNSITALKAENEALRKDAERYRWLRDPDHLTEDFMDGPADNIVVGACGGEDILWDECLDAEIDKAMSKAKSCTHSAN